MDRWKDGWRDILHISSLPWAYSAHPGLTEGQSPHCQDPSPTDLYWAWKWLCTKLCPRGCRVPGGDLLALLLPSLPGCRGKRHAVSEVTE